MKKSNKKFIASLLAISLAAPVFSGIPVFAENSDGTIVDQTQPLTVVGKRITGDDTYFEISLEVNGDYDEYSSVGVVLRYDPDYIIPAESWDEDAGAADMSENTSWATRRALPTLGLETWSTHTALAYQEDAPAAGSAKKYGYLYLGAEHPLGVETPALDPSASPDPTADPSASTPEPTASPTPGTRPVVVARFMYNTDAAAVPPVTGKDTREKLENDWLNGVNGSGAAQPTNWDYDWTSNAILRIASDEVSGKSPAQYPFAIYTQDYEEKAYMETWPAVTPTVTPAPGAPTPTPMPVSAYAPVIGAGIDTANRLTKDDIMVITCVGESAKATGGLKLSDIYVILFFDWDDTLIGTLTAGVGEDPTEAVHNYVKSKFIHPELRDLDYASMTDAEKKERKNNYRGEYPENGPDASDPLAKSGAYGDGSAQPGSNYPLTNKLDYSFAGKNLLDEDHPYTFAYGWTQVLPSTPDYSDTTKYPGVLPQVLPKNMEDTFTARDPRLTSQPYGWKPELDASGNLVNATDKIPTWTACDFSKITQDDLKESDGNLYVKAVYTDCEWLGRDNSNSLYNTYETIGPADIQQVGVATATKSTFAISFTFERLNKYGHGVGRTENPLLNMALMQKNATGDTPIKVMLENKDIIPVTLNPTNAVATVGYQLRDKDIISGDERSTANALTGSPFKLSGTDGILFQRSLQSLLEQAYQYALAAQSSGVEYKNSTDYNTTWTDAATWTSLAIYKSSTKTKATAISGATNLKYAQTAIVELVGQKLNRGEDYKTLTWSQMQYAVIKKTAKGTNVAYVDSATADAFLSDAKYGPILDAYNAI